jgi:AcrR family transcriptional regulator
MFSPCTFVMLDIVSSYKKNLKTQLDTVSSGKSRSRILDAALALIVKRGGADVTMMEIAKAAGLSRQAVYLHFADRAELLVSVARHADEKRGLYAEIRKITDAPSGIDALREAASLQARTNPGIWAIARAVDAVRRTDEAAERSWQDRLESRLHACKDLIARLRREGVLRPGLTLSAAADLLWSITSLRMWEDLVLQRRWTPRQYEEGITQLLLNTLTTHCEPRD